MNKYYVDGKSKPSTDPLDFDEPVGIYLADIVDEAIVAKDRDLADANHALLLANNSADAFRRVAKCRVELAHNEVSCLEQIKEFLDAQYMIGHQGYYSGCGWVGATLAEIIKKAQKATTGASNG